MDVPLRRNWLCQLNPLKFLFQKCGESKRSILMYGELLLLFVCILPTHAHIHIHQEQCTYVIIYIIFLSLNNQLIHLLNKNNIKIILSLRILHGAVGNRYLTISEKRHAVVKNHKRRKSFLIYAIGITYHVVSYVHSISALYCLFAS